MGRVRGGRESARSGASPDRDQRAWRQWRSALEIFLGARQEKSYLEADYAPGDFLVFGSETKGLGEEFLGTRTEATYRIPIFEPGVRSLNLANAVSIVLYEALRRTGRLIA